MNHRETFEDEGFVYELNVESANPEIDRIHTVSQGDGFYCQWLITGKESHQVREVAVTDDNCDIIVFTSVEAAVRGARAFLNI